ncbi:hypothetical protein NDU88_001521 [Pleurodeles waltl]|uniref:Uncharacterized protein n=1 Tax=Pleurodeles waltl TaxID=8319 RepID=A0AAV7SZF4_PLEWA|nr:hypothetical protein NDU88_001521 [Pleurodeles waltl]
MVVRHRVHYDSSRQYERAMIKDRESRRLRTRIVRCCQGLLLPLQASRKLRSFQATNLLCGSRLLRFGSRRDYERRFGDRDPVNVC